LRTHADDILAGLSSHDVVVLRLTQVETQLSQIVRRRIRPQGRCDGGAYR